MFYTLLSRQSVFFGDIRRAAFCLRRKTFCFLFPIWVGSLFVSFGGYIGMGRRSASLIDCAALCVFRGGK